MSRPRAADLLEANEHLVLAVIRAQEEADRAALALRKLDRSMRLEAVVGAPDGSLLFERLVHALAVARRSDLRLGLLFVSLGNIEEINDAVGHAAGGQVISLASRRLGGAVRESDLVSRLDDHQFLVQLTALSQAADAVGVAEAAVAALELPIQMGGKEFRLKVSVGISVYPDDGDDADALVDRATAAMYHARREGVPSYFFVGEPATNARSLELRQAEAHWQAVPPLPSAPDAAIDLKTEVNQQLILTALHAQELVAAAELAQREQAAFIGVVAHELRGPLGPLSNAAQLLARAKARQLAIPAVHGIIDQQVAHLGRLVNDLLDVARFNTGKLRLDVRRLDLRELLLDCCDAVRPAMQARGQALLCGVLPAEILVNGDRVRLTQIFRNLLDNAAKYTPEGGAIVLAASVEADAIVIDISDNGIGIAADVLPQVFERYVQEGRAMCFNPSGLGIGLALVRELVAAHDGEVMASSDGPGLGSRFTVRLPLLVGCP